MVSRWRLLVLVLALLAVAAACGSGGSGATGGARPDGLPPEVMGGGDAVGDGVGDGDAGQGAPDGLGDAGQDEGGFGDAADEGGDAPVGGPGTFFGVWRSSQQSPFGPMQVETIFQENGKFQQESAAGGTLILIWGRFDVYEDQAHLRFTLEGWEPKEWCGPLGCEEIHYPEGESHTYRWVDADTLMTAPRYCTGDDCWVTHHRV